MFKLEPLNNEIEAKTLPLSDRLFHVALREAPESAARFHVKNDRGEDFDIVYWDNEDDIEPTEGYPAYVKPPFIAKYPYYDETDTGTLYLGNYRTIRRHIWRCLFRHLLLADFSIYRQ